MQAGKDHRTRVRKWLSVAEQAMSPMRSDDQRVHLKCEFLRVEAGLQVSAFLSSSNGLAQNAKPRPHCVGNTVAYRAGAAVKLEGRCCKETSSGKHAFFDMAQPSIPRRPKPGHAFRLGKGRADHVLHNDLARHLARPQL